MAILGNKEQTLLVGREHELSTIQQSISRRLWSPNRQNIAQGLLLFSSAGNGKSRLLQEALRRAELDARAFSLWVARPDPTRSQAPLGLVSAMLRRAVGLSDGEALGVQRAKLSEFLSSRLSPIAFSQRAEFIGELVGVPFERESLYLRAARQDPRLMSDQLLRAWLALLNAECQASPLLLCIDDLQWADQASLKWFDSSLKELAEAPFFILAATRPEIKERSPKLWSERFIDEIWLSALSVKSRREMILQSLGDEASEPLIEQLSQQSQGNAFYLEELVRAVASGNGNFPETILAVTQHRLMGLPADARRLLRAASIFGQDFWQSAASLLLNEPEERLSVSLTFLLREEILFEQPSSRFDGEEEFSFGHSLLREAAYTLLTEQEKTAGHRLAAEWLEEHQEQDFSLLASHFELGGQQEKALEFSFKAALQAFTANDLQGALSFSEQGKRCGAQGELLGQLCLLQAEVHNWQASFAQAEVLSLEAMRYFTRGSSLWYRAVAEAVLACGRLNHVEQLSTLGKALQACQWSSALGVAPLIAIARAAPRLLYAGQEATANAILTQLTKSISSQNQDPICTAWIETGLLSHYFFLESLDQSMVHAERAYEAFMEIGDLRNACMQRMDAGFNALMIGRFSEAIEKLTECIHAAEELDIKRIPGAALRGLCFAYAFSGDLVQGEACARRSIKALSAQGDKQQEANSRIRLCRILIEQHKLQEARVEVQIALDTLPQGAPVRPYAIAVCAKLALLGGDAKGAQNLAAEALRSFVKLRSIELGEAFIRLVYAEALVANYQMPAAKAAAKDALLHLEQRAKRFTFAKTKDSFYQIPDHARTISLAAQLGAT